MKLLIHIIERHIKQLEHADLKKWLLLHLNKEASHLGMLFSKQYPTNNVTPARIDTLGELYFIVTLIHTYGPRALLPELEAIASMSVEQATRYNQSFLTQSAMRLKDFSTAWPLLIQLARQPQEIMKHLQNAGRPTLQAFKRLVVANNDWSLLAELFLVEDNYGLQTIDGQKLINFLRRPQWVNEFKQLIHSLTTEARSLLCLHWVIQYGDKTDELRCLQQMQKFYSEHPFTLDAQLVKTVVNYYIPSFQLKESFSINKEFIVFLDTLFNSMSVEQQLAVIRALTVFDRIDLIEHCIGAQALVSGACFAAYHRVLFLLCAHTAAFKKEDRELVRLQLLKMGVLSFNVPNGLHNLDIVQSLHKEIASPRFMSTATPQMINSISLRYRCLALTYTHEELLDFFVFAKNISPYYPVFIKNLKSIQNTLANNPQHKELIEKRCRLIDWFMERLVHALMRQLIIESMNNQRQHREVLTSLFDYYCQLGTSLRADLFFHAVNHFYSGAYEQSKLACGHASKFDQWCRSYKGLGDGQPQQSDSYLYNESGHCIAVVDELNRVWSLTGDEPILVGQEKKAEQDYFNQYKIQVGTLTDGGYFRLSGRASREVSAHILAVASITELEQAPRGLFLLITHFLSQNSIHLLDDYKEYRQDPIKRRWLEHQCGKVIKELASPLAPSTANNLITHFHTEYLLSLIPDITYTANAVLLFHNFLANKTFCESWLNGRYTPTFHRILQQHGGMYLADYLRSYSKTPWFLEGLVLFATAPLCHQPGLLAQALGILSANVEQNQLPVKILKVILRRLSKSELAAQVLLEHFGQDNCMQPVQEVHSKGLDDILRFFDKSHLMHLISQLIIKPSWEQSHQYRLALYILQAHQESLFTPLEGGTSPWQEKDIYDFAVFINRHLEEKNIWDNKSSLGFKVLGAFTLHQAEQGQTAVFCNGTKKMSRVAAFLVSPKILEQLVGKFILPRFAQEGTVPSKKDTPREHGQYREQRVADLADNARLQTWSKLIKHTENQPNKYIPLLGIYLLHYSGSAFAVRQVLDRYFQSIKLGKQCSLIHPISAFLMHFPQQDISAVLFDSLQNTVMDKPLLLDLTILRHLSHYWGLKEGLRSQSSFHVEMQLITHWGNRKCYALVHQACQLLLIACEDSVTRQKLKATMIAAQVETRIQHHLQESPRLYAVSIKWMKRLWHYGFNWRRAPTELLVLADEGDILSASGQKTFSPAQISTGCKVNIVKSTKERDDIIYLLSQVVRSSFSASCLLSAPVSASLFDGKTKGVLPPECTFTDAASQQSKANV
jgi:hypothetical protein